MFIFCVSRSNQTCRPTPDTSRNFEIATGEFVKLQKAAGKPVKPEKKVQFTKKVNPRYRICTRAR